MSCNSLPVGERTDLGGGKNKAQEEWDSLGTTDHGQLFPASHGERLKAAGKTRTQDLDFPALKFTALALC
jgi:hypothetical protein